MIPDPSLMADACCTLAALGGRRLSLRDRALHFLDYMRSQDARLRHLGVEYADLYGDDLDRLMAATREIIDARMARFT